MHSRDGFSHRIVEVEALLVGLASSVTRAEDGVWLESNFFDHRVAELPNPCPENAVEVWHDFHPGWQVPGPVIELARTWRNGARVLGYLSLYGFPVDLGPSMFAVFDFRIPNIFERPKGMAEGDWVIAVYRNDEGSHVIYRQSDGRCEVTKRFDARKVVGRTWPSVWSFVEDEITRLAALYDPASGLDRSRANPLSAS